VDFATCVELRAAATKGLAAQIEAMDRYMSVETALRESGFAKTEDFVRAELATWNAWRALKLEEGKIRRELASEIHASPHQVAFARAQRADLRTVLEPSPEERADPGAQLDHVLFATVGSVAWAASWRGGALLVTVII